MCGRYNLFTPLDTLRTVFGFEGNVNLAARYNIAPGTDVPVIGRKKDRPETGIVMMRWGLVPSWAKDTKIGYRMINARAETIHSKPAFAPSFEKRRCILPADGFFEWMKTHNGKVAYNIRRSDLMPMAFAGIWDRYQDKNTGQKLYSCAVITCPANGALKKIHHRMPVILGKDDINEWLAPETTPDQAYKLLRPCPSDIVDVYEVSSDVNSITNDNATLVRPLQNTC